jgi:hypothetical protein
VTKTYTTKYPRGVACHVWKGLKKRYQPDGINLTLEFNKELNSVTMSKDEDPNVMIDKLEALSARYNTLGLPVLEETIVACALVVAPIVYASALTAEKCMREICHAKLTLDDVRSSMDTLYSTNYLASAKAANKQSDSAQEVRLSNISSGRGGRGRGRSRGRGRGRGNFTCCNCGKAGHTAIFFRSGGTSDPKSTDGDARHCNYCGKDGHLEHTCWLKPGNKVSNRAVKGLQDELRELRASSIAQGQSTSNTNETVLCALDVTNDIP